MKLFLSLLMFLSFLTCQNSLVEGNEIHCPCWKCPWRNACPQDGLIVEEVLPLPLTHRHRFRDFERSWRFKGERHENRRHGHTRDKHERHENRRHGHTRDKHESREHHG